MKKLLLLSMFMSINSHAMFLDSPEYVCYGMVEGQGSNTNLCLLSTTISLPTMIVKSTEINLHSPEAQERLQAELNGDVEPELLELISHEKNISIEELKSQLIKQ